MQGVAAVPIRAHLSYRHRSLSPADSEDALSAIFTSFGPFFRGPLAVEPDVFHAPAVEAAVDHDCQPLQLWLHAGHQAAVVEDRARPVLLQFPVDLPDQPPALIPVGHRRLLDELLLQIGVAIAGIVALRSAAVILEEL